MTTDRPVEPHPSGCGAYLTPPIGLYFRFWRTPGPTEEILDDQGELIEVVDVPVLCGRIEEYRCYLDWDLPIGKPLHYRLELSQNEDGPWKTFWEDDYHLEPDVMYSALEDGLAEDVVNPRDALVVFYSTRLAALARQGKLFVKNPGHKLKFPVTTAYEWNDAEAPMLCIFLAHGEGGEFDLGWENTEEHLKLGMIGASPDKRERDSLTNALRGLMKELAWFLDDLGCVNTRYGELEEGIQESDPFLHRVDLSIGTTSLTWTGDAGGDWEFLPIGGWVSEGAESRVF